MQTAKNTLDKVTDEENKTIKIALAGNPNCGKTTLFNRLTGSSQYVGNWPGVTVEKKEGRVKYNKKELTAVDLPGIYSLSPYTPEEIVSRNCLINDNIDIIIDIVDATNIERNLYLTTQLSELGKPMIIALNMIDMLEKNGDKIDVFLLEKLLGIPVMPISASKNTGIDEMLERAVAVVQSKKESVVKNIYSKEVDTALRNIEEALDEVERGHAVNKRWNSVKLFEGDNITQKNFNFTEQQAKHIRSHIEEIKTTEFVDREMIIADQRYKYICGICQKAVTKKHKQGYVTASDKIDRIATGRFTAIPTFLIIMLSIFVITFGPLGNFLCDGVDYIINTWFSGVVLDGLTAVGASDWAISLVCDGIISGIGAVLSFLPQILILFLLLSVLEDSGYMARAAFIMDKLLRKIGLSGRAFVPMLMGFGCTVPAVMGTRTLESVKDKRLTILITPFMSCSAKMPVYLLFISVFFAKYGALVVFSIYIIGIIVAILSALLLKNTILKGKAAPFVMELPPYRIPTLKNLWLHVWERLKDFLTKAGTVLLGATVVIWFLQSFDFSLHLVDDSTNSMLSSIGTFIAPVFSPCGFGDWRASVSLLTGIAAKESVVSTMAILFEGGNAAIASVFSPLSAFSFLVFVLLYTPCIASLSAIHRELNSRKWTIFAVVYQLAVAWFVSMLVFQIGTLIGCLF